MGRRPDGPGVQAAKGNPNRRKAGTERREARVKAAREALAQKPVENGSIPLAIRGNDRAIDVYNRLGPQLRATQRLAPEDEDLFCILCVAFAEWGEMQEQVLEHGHWQNIPHHADPTVMKAVPHPAKKARNEAELVIRLHAPTFGIGAAHRFALYKNQQLAALMSPDLFADQPSRKQEQRAAPASEASLIGSLSQLDSPPPGTVVN